MRGPSNASSHDRRHIFVIHGPGGSALSIGTNGLDPFEGNHAQVKPSFVLIGQSRHACVLMILIRWCQDTDQSPTQITPNPATDEVEWSWCIIS